MPEPEHHLQDERLQAVLREWVVDLCLPPRFEEGVWRRIQRAEAAPPKATSLAKLLLVRWLSALARPTAAALFVVLFLLVGGFAGLVEARRQTARVNEDLRALYVQTISPYTGNH